MDISDWQTEFGDLAHEACREAMGYYEQIDAEWLAWRMPMILSRAAARQAARVGKPADMRSATSAAQVECIARHTPHQGYFLTRAYQLRYPGFDGAASPVVNREVFVATDAAIVLPYDPVHDRVLLVEQFRMGPYGRGDPRPWMLEPVAGRVDAGETPEQTARRECVEEAGLNLRALELISRHYCTPGTSTEYFHLYLGLCDLPQAGHGLGGLACENEDIRTHVISFDQAMSLLDTGEADNGPLVLSLIWLSRERERLRSAA
jgi:nudix-type nucleoside diphosphatase (YffH/AdpP family)